MSEWQDYSDDFQWKDSFSSLRGKLVQIGESIWYSAGGSCGGMVQYSIKTNKIVSKTKYSTNIKPPINHCCCKFNNTIIIVNGDQGEIISFNPSTKQFEKKINTPEIGWKACCINMNNDIHIFHGIHNCKHLIYSPKTNKLKILNDATTTQNIEEVCVLKYGNKLIRFGGYCMDEMKSLNSLFISSPVIQMNKTNKTIKWQLKCKLVKGLFGCGYILYDNTYIITFGGSHSWAEYIDTIFVLNIKQNGNWFELKQIKCPLPSAYLAILDSENNIHLFTQHNKHAVKKHFVCKISTILRHIYDAVEVFNKEIRVSWQIGSNCRIYSRSSDKWYAGKVDKICGSGEDEWLVVKYSVNNKNKKKEIQRNCKDIKPFIPVLKYKENEIKKTMREYRKLTVYGYIRNHMQILFYLFTDIIDIIYKFYLIEKKTLYCNGWNYCGQLGLGYNNFKVKELTKCEWSVNNAITNIIPSYNRNIFQINNSYYSSPTLKNTKNNYTPTMIAYFRDNNIINIVKCVGFPNIFDKFVCVWITKSNDLYTLCKEKWQKITYFNDNNLNIHQVAWDGSYSGPLILCKNGLVYYCSNTIYQKWNVINNIEMVKIKIIAMSAIHTIFVSEMGSVWICSYNERGYLGFEHKYINDRYPEKIKYFRKNKIKIISVTCGSSHTLLLDDKNIVYAIGFNECGECGIGTMQTVFTPQIIFKNASQICCGFSHSLIKSMNGKYYFFGRNDFGECLSEKEKNVLTPTCMDNQIYSVIGKKEKILCIKVGAFNTFILTDKS
eukprot:222265_1